MPKPLVRGATVQPRSADGRVLSAESQRTQSPGVELTTESPEAAAPAQHSTTLGDRPRTKPGFRKPWDGGAYAYPEADSFADAHEGFKRKRTSVLFHMPNTGEAGQELCASCGIKLADPYPVNAYNGRGQTSTDKWSSWNWDAKRKAVTGGMHYGCSWGSLLTELAKIREY